MKKEEIFEYVKKQYGTVPEYLWAQSPDNAVLRHKNGKWYAVVMTVEKSKLGLEGKDPVDIMDVKCDPDMTNMIIQTYGFLPGYHMNKQHWITILLDGSVSEAKTLDFLDMSYDLIDGADRKKRRKCKWITVIFEQKENRGFYSSVFWLLCFSLQLEKYLLQALSGNVPAGLQSQERDFVLHVRCGLSSGCRNLWLQPNLLE